MGRLLRRAVVAATAGIGASMLVPMAAHAAVSCGQTITTSITLDHDLHCPASHGINIGASNVVLDLGGHTITGPAPGSGSTLRGVGVLSNRTGVTVRNGAIRGFDQGVDVHPGANNTTLTGLTLDRNGLGIRINTGASANRVIGNTIVNTTQFSAIQMGGNGHLVENNTMSNGNGAGVFLSGNDNVVRGNRINEMGQNAVSIGAFPTNPGPFVNNQVIGNQISGSGRVGNATSMVVSNGSGTRIEGNSVNGRRATPGIFVLNSAGTVVAGNALTNNSSTGVLVRGTSTGTRVIGNQSSQNTFSGITIEDGPTSTVVADNFVSGNGGNGIDVRSPSTTVARNTAVYNANLGIFAVAGVTDGGGNRAFGNGNPAQCSPPITCSS